MPLMELIHFVATEVAVELVFVIVVAPEIQTFAVGRSVLCLMRSTGLAGLHGWPALRK